MPISKRSLPKIKNGTVIEVVFLDHVASVGGLSYPLRCRVIGELVNQDRQALYLASWLTEENDTANLDSHTVLKSTIESVSIIRKGKKR